MIEGWGLTHDNRYLYSSDGTHNIYKIDPDTFTVVDSIQVTDTYGNQLEYINELEMVGNYIYANVLPSNVIFKIDKVTGEIVKKYDMGDLYSI